MNIQTEHSFRILPKKLISFTLHSLNHVAYFFANLKIGPNTLSFMALISGIGAGVLFFFKHPLWAGAMIGICGLFDILDGQVAANTNQKSLFGAIFDSVLDRYSEFFIYLGLAAYFRHHWALWLTFWTILGSAMVSYARARAEGLGIECRIGIMQRAERMLLLFLGSIIGSLGNIFDQAMITVLAIIAVFSNITAIQRTLYVKKIEKQKKLRKEVRQNGQN
jgi:CDP-diacylglycerol--glycerol-3-phosphate 3-phosphatidyltransferase